MAEIDIEENHGCATLLQRRERRGGRPELAHYPEAGLLLENPRQSLPEHGVIVDKKKVDDLCVSGFHGTPDLDHL